MSKILLTTYNKTLINYSDNFFFSNRSFFKHFDENNTKINFQFIKPLEQNKTTRYQAENETDHLTKIIESDLYNNLNDIHSLGYSNKYWKIILGHWLSRYIKIVYFRYKLLQHCFKQTRDIDFTLASKFNDFSQSISNTSDIWLASIDDNWNFNLFSKILSKAFINKCEIKFVDIQENYFNPKINNKINTSKEIIKTNIQNFLSYLNYFGKKNKIVFKNSYLSFLDEIYLSFLNKEFPTFLVNKNYKKFSLNKKLRDKINISNGKSDSFENLVRELIPDALPRVVLEDYKSILDSVNNSNWPKNPKVIFTSNSYDGDDFFKFWTADKVETKKSLYIIGQHGLFDSSEKLLFNSNEYQSCDKYLRWGKKKYEKDVELFNFKLINRKFINKNNNNIFIISRTTGHEVETFSRYDEYDFYNQCLINLLSNIEGKKDDKIILRLKRTFKWTNPKEFKEIKKLFPKILIDDGVNDIFSLLKKTKLAVYLYYSTGVLETLSLDIPTIFYFPRELTYIEEEEQKFLNILHDCKIVAYTQNELVENFNFITNDLLKWWSSDLVRKSKEEFCSRYSIKPPKKSILKISKLLNSFCS